MEIEAIEAIIQGYWYRCNASSSTLLDTCLNPQNLRNIIKKVAKITIIQILMSNVSVKTTVFCYFFAAS